MARCCRRETNRGIVIDQQVFGGTAGPIEPCFACSRLGALRRHRLLRASWLRLRDRDSDGSSGGTRYGARISIDPVSYRTDVVGFAGAVEVLGTAAPDVPAVLVRAGQISTVSRGKAP